MMRIRPASGAELDTAVMSDLGLVRYLGYAELPEAAALKARLERERADALEAGVHLDTSNYRPFLKPGGRR
jgi:hypothetical protein